MAPSRDYLLVVRYPTGGIRTHLKYLAQYANASGSTLAPVLVAPDDAEGALLAATLSLDDPNRVAKQCQSMAQLVSRCVELSRKYQTRLVHSHGFTSAIAAAAAVELRGQRHVVTVHDVVTPGLLSKTNKASLVALGVVLRRAYAVHAVGEDCAETLRLLPMMKKARNIVVIRNGIDVAQFSNVKRLELRSTIGVSETAFLFGYFGRFMAQKGFRTLVDAASLIEQSAKIQDFCVVAFGSGGFIREDKQYVEDKGLSHRFRFCDPLENPAPAMASVDAIVMPSRWEAYPLLAPESFVLGIPLIASTCIGLREATDRTPARTFPPDNASALADQMVKEAASPTTSQARAFATEAARRFDVTPSAMRIQQLLERAYDDSRLEP